MWTMSEVDIKSLWHIEYMVQVEWAADEEPWFSRRNFLNVWNG